MQSCNPTGVGNGFLAEINAAGTLTFSTCLGQGTLPMFQAGIADLVLGPSGNVYVIGSGGGSLPLVNPIQSHLGYIVGTSGTSSDLFVAEVGPRTPALLFLR